MSIQHRYGLTPVINAAGTYTPVGVSRSAAAVSEATALALGEFLVIDELKTLVSRKVRLMTGAQAATVTHCVSAGITLSVAACMCGESAERIAALPDSTGLPSGVVLARVHAIDYGHPLVQDIRLAGASPVLAGKDDACSLADLEQALDTPGLACLLLVSSRLVRGPMVDLAAAVQAAHDRGLPAIIDAAAQDMRLRELLATHADLVLVSAHKYLAAPTAGLILGSEEMVSAVRAQDKGIGRAMKATKEALAGVLAALEVRERLDVEAWRHEQSLKVERFLGLIAELPDLVAEKVPDPAGMPFCRVHVRPRSGDPGARAAQLARALRNSTPSIWAMEHLLSHGDLVFELVPLCVEEIDALASALRQHS